LKDDDGFSKEAPMPMGSGLMFSGVNKFNDTMPRTIGFPDTSSTYTMRIFLWTIVFTVIGKFSATSI